MKKTIIATAISFILLIALISCTQTPTSDTSDNSALISSLESELAALREEQSASDSDNQKRIDELTSLLNSLLAAESAGGTNATSNSTPSQSSEATTETAPKAGFTYTVTDGNATLTGYTGSETSIVVPTSIDGYTVTAIGDSAFRDSKIKSIALPNSVESIGWFAFDGCTRLTAITVPSSVKKIAYGAFGSSDSSLTIYCHSDSFALKYAKSYGLSYAII